MLNLIPQPQHVQVNQGTIRINSVSLSNCSLDSEVVEDFFGFCKSIGIVKGSEANIDFEEVPSLEAEEYILSIDNEISIKASTVSGQVYGLETLKQILFQCKGNIPKLEIKDKPKYKVRGFMLDVGRYFYSVSDVKAVIRRMALHKLNLLHFHLTEDQGWRVQIDKFPLLVAVGSKREKTNFNHTQHGGFYTKEDIKEIVRYAHCFGVKVMPEFDVPGHSRSAIACYKELSCFERQLPVANHWGVKHDVLCAGKDFTYDFVYGVIDELCELFPDEYFHIGGDEVPKHRWDLCPHCQNKIKELGLENSEQLQFYFMNKIKDYCQSKGKKVFMWSWDLKNTSNLDDDICFTQCNDGDTKGREFIDTSTSAYYIDFPYGYTSLEDTANHKVLAGNCLGLEVTLWTEYVPDMKKADFMSFPRTGAMCETAWAGQCGYDNFSNKLDFYYSYLSKNGIGYAKLGTANPNKAKGFLQGLWFEKRQLTWQGLTNIIDDKKVEKLAKSYEK